jgi:hypothetical protein
MKKWVIFTLILVMVLVPSNLLGASNRQNLLNNPPNATNVELVKKGSMNTPQGKGNISKTFATGILGDKCTGNKYAIVIGISDYPGTVNDLKYADEDALDMISALTTTYEFNPSNIYSLIDAEGNGAVNATRTNILNAINNLSTIVTSNDEVVFFFSGHGMKGIADDGDNERIDEAIVVHDGINIVPIWDGELKTAFSDFKTTRMIFFFDSCLAGGMTDLQSPGRIINMATTETGTAYEFDSLQNGQFTYYFIDQGILHSKADTHPLDYKVTDEEAFDYSLANCMKQTPVISDQFTNDLLP